VKDARLVARNLRRRPGRTTLAVLGIASALLMIVLVEALGAGLDAVLSDADAARTLIVYRAHRYCPQTSNLPERYGERIAALPGVESVLPVKVFLNNCRASLDTVAFHGVPAGAALALRGLRVVSGDAQRFVDEPDAALVGGAFAARKGLDVGDRFRFGGIDVKVAGLFRDPSPAREGLILTHLDYLQRSGPVNRPGEVTEFEVRVADASRARAVAESIDALFATAEAPTDTRPESQFLQGATRDLRELLRFARGLGLACALVVLALVANTLFMSVHERTAELAMLRALGFTGGRLGAHVLGEALLLAVAGGTLGVLAALAVLAVMHPTLGAEGVPVSLSASPALLLRAAGLLLGAGALAGLFPALLSARRPVAAALRGP
jgi:putative ABC transport system permease protein